MSNYRILNTEQIESFMQKGYLIVRDCIDLDVANKWIDDAFERLGYDKNDQATWTESPVWLNHQSQMPVRELAPKAWDAILDVIGGEDRIDTQIYGIESKHFTTINSFVWSDAFVANFNYGAGETWRPPSAEAPGWHKDGSFFRHFLDSREQALLTVVMWSDMMHQGGGTFVAPDSVRVVARYLADHPEGVHPNDFDFKSLIQQCGEFEELNGKAGDFVIIHPFMLHASSQNLIQQPRFMSNPPVVLKDPMDFNRDDPAEFSLLEKATLNYLGKDRYDFQPTAERESFWWPV